MRLLAMCAVLCLCLQAGCSESAVDRAEREARERDAAGKAVADRADFEALLKKNGLLPSLVTQVSEGRDPDTVKVTVNNAWLLMQKQQRLQSAQDLRGAWAKIHSPEDGDKSGIMIVDKNGNRLATGYSGTGSLIRINE